MIILPPACAGCSGKDANCCDEKIGVRQHAPIAAQSCLQDDGSKTIVTVVREQSVMGHSPLLGAHEIASWRFSIVDAVQAAPSNSAISRKRRTHQDTVGLASQYSDKNKMLRSPAALV